MGLEAIAEQVGQMIKEARLKAGLTQKELGVKLGISQVAVNHYEKGSRNLSLEVIQRIATALAVNFNINVKS